MSFLGAVLSSFHGTVIHPQDVTAILLAGGAATIASAGVGLSDEYPQIKYRQDWDRAGYDGVIEQGMVLCIESFTGSDRGGEGVKLEQMVHVTASGTELLSTDPWDPVLYG